MLTIANYHYIRENFDNKYPSIFGVTPYMFEKQLLLLLSKNAKFVCQNDLIDYKNKILNSNENFFLVTFDDGLKEQYEKALPILDKLKIPAIFFANSRNFENKKVSTVHKIHLLRSIVSPANFLLELKNYDKTIQIIDQDIAKAKSIYIYDNIESASLKYLLNFKIDFAMQEGIINAIFDKHFNENEVVRALYMNENEIINLAQKGYLGSHTHNHFPVGLLNESEMKFELENSKQYFENLTKTKIEMVAYPYGTPESCTIQVAKTAKEVGYKYGFTTTRGINTTQNNLLLLNRFDCNDLPGGKNYKS